MLAQGLRVSWQVSGKPAAPRDRPGTGPGAVIFARGKEGSEAVCPCRSWDPQDTGWDAGVTGVHGLWGCPWSTEQLVPLQFCATYLQLGLRLPAHALCLVVCAQT